MTFSSDEATTDHDVADVAYTYPEAVEVEINRYILNNMGRMTSDPGTNV
jgi:hypothetical protein